MKQTTAGLLLVVSGPAGVGKGTVDSALMARHPEIKMSVSATTRAPRPGEIDGTHYFFKSLDEFRTMIERDEFLEYMHVFGMNYYGTPKSYVLEQLALGHHVILEIDVQGARKVKQTFPSAVLVFIAPPSMETLKNRLIGRGTETSEAIEIRTQTAYRELEALPEYDYVVVNDSVDAAVDEMESIIRAELCSTAHNKELIENLLGGKNVTC